MCKSPCVSSLSTHLPGTAFTDADISPPPTTNKPHIHPPSAPHPPANPYPPHPPSAPHHPHCSSRDPPAPNTFRRVHRISALRDVPAHLRRTQVKRPLRLPRRHITARPSVIHHRVATALSRQCDIPQLQPPPRSPTHPAAERDTPPVSTLTLPAPPPMPSSVDKIPPSPLPLIQAGDSPVEGPQPFSMDASRQAGTNPPSPTKQ